ncbi:hypothetical protein MO973_25470 [Paenibacillus sp. TRM 82003]|nr:hypothetical protein [Paenibacillus sp. TRM 82003]
MVTVQHASFVRLGYSGDETFAEVEVQSDGRERPLVATFKQERDGRLTLVNVTEKQDDHNLDWYENNLHEAYPSVMNSLFEGAEGEAERDAFAEQVLGFGDVRATIEDTIYYGN